MRIVIVEDEPNIRNGLNNMIDKYTYHSVVGTANSGTEGISIIKETSPDLVITDIKMPNMNGLEMLEILRKEKINCQAIIVSGYSDFEFAKKAINLNVTDYVLKPIDLDELVSSIENVEKRIPAIRKPLPFVLGDSANEDSQLTTSNEIVLKVISFIRNNFDKNIGLSDAAKVANMTPEYLSKLFTQEMGVGFVVFLRNFRVSEAKRLLNKGDKVQDVSKQVGFHDVKYFNKVFKSVCSVSPTEYKKQITEVGSVSE